MTHSDTSLGGPRGSFPKTTWGAVSRLTDETRPDLELLCRRYWKPVYRTLRITRARSNEDAKDLTQAFFLWLMEGEVLSRYEPERGSFRRFLKVLLDRFAADQEEALRRLKRGGGVRILALDEGEAPLEEILPDPRAAEPSDIFDRAWAIAVSRHAIEEVGRRYRSDGRAGQFRVFEEYDLAPERERPTYAELGRRHGLTEVDVGHVLAAVRGEVMTELRRELVSLTTDERGLEEEWDALFGA